MKTRLMCVAVLMVACGMCWAQAEMPTMETSASMAIVPIVPSAENGEAIARAFLAHDVTTYYGWMNFLRVPISGKPYWVSGNFTMTPSGWITDLVIDGKVVPPKDGEPFAGLPINRDGSATLFNVNLNGVDENGRYVVNGSFYEDLLSSGDPITVTLHPGNEERIIEFALPEGVDPMDLRVRLGDGGVWSYDSLSGRFNLWVNPTISLSYEIFSVSTGAIYERGNLDDNGIEGSGGENIVSLIYGGVSALLMSESEGWGDLRSATFDHSVIRDDWFIPAKVVMTRAYGQAMFVQAIDLPYDGRIEVRAWAPAGQELPIIAVADVVYVDDDGVGKGGYGSGYYYATLQTPVGYDRLVVTITGTTGGTFEVYLSRGGLGKG